MILIRMNEQYVIYIHTFRLLLMLMLLQNLSYSLSRLLLVVQLLRQLLGFVQQSA